MAVQACAAGFDSVAMIDTDPQGSLHDWWNMRQDATPALIRSSAGNLAEDLEKLRAQGHRLAMIDTQRTMLPPMPSPRTCAAISTA